MTDGAYIELCPQSDGDCRRALQCLAAEGVRFGYMTDLLTIPLYAFYLALFEMRVGPALRDVCFVDGGKIMP